MYSRCKLYPVRPMNFALTVTQPRLWSIVQSILCKLVFIFCWSSVCAVTLSAGTEESSGGGACHAELWWTPNRSPPQNSDSSISGRLISPVCNCNSSPFSCEMHIRIFLHQGSVPLQECFPHCTRYFIFNLMYVPTHTEEFLHSLKGILTRQPVKEVPVQAISCQITGQ